MANEKNEKSLTEHTPVPSIRGEDHKGFKIMNENELSEIIIEYAF